MTEVVGIRSDNQVDCSSSNNLRFKYTKKLVSKIVYERQKIGGSHFSHPFLGSRLFSPEMSVIA